MQVKLLDVVRPGREVILEEGAGGGVAGGLEQLPLLPGQPQVVEQEGSGGQEVPGTPDQAQAKVPLAGLHS